MTDMIHHVTSLLMIVGIAIVFASETIEGIRYHWRDTLHLIGTLMFTIGATTYLGLASFSVMVWSKTGVWP